jgi:hypothetical protein
MSILNIFQIVLYSAGAIGVCLGMNWYFRRPLPLVISIVVTASVFAMFLGNTLPYLWLATSGNNGSARVVAVDCLKGEKHHIRYEFSVGSTFVNDLGSDGYGNPTCEVLKVGNFGVVTYISSDPSVHVWGKASEYLGERLVGLLVMLVSVPIFSYAGVKKRVDQL